MVRPRIVTWSEKSSSNLSKRLWTHCLVENVPPEQLPHRGSRNAGIAEADDTDSLVLGVFEGVPTTRKSVFDVPSGPDRIVLYQKNIEAVCSNEDEIRQEVRLTVIHELGHYFGMTEAQLEDV